MCLKFYEIFVEPFDRIELSSDDYESTVITVILKWRRVAGSVGFEPTERSSYVQRFSRPPL